MNKNLLLIGPMKNRKNPLLTGGAIVLFENLLIELNKQNIEYIAIDTNKKNYPNIIIAYILIYIKITYYSFKTNCISIHSSKDYIFLSPYIILLGKIFRKTTILRKFGGEAWEIYKDSKGLKKYILNYIFLNTNYIFFETKYLVKEFKKINSNTFWFPNVRTSLNIKKYSKKFLKKFVFIGHVIKEKGIDEIIKVKNKLDSSYSIDIFGPINNNNYSYEYFKKHSISYKGILNQNEVISTLLNYDVLLLPSHKEGYSGVIIESYLAGLPVIVNRLKALDEIVVHNKTGLIVNTKNITEFKNAILYFNNKNYTIMSKNAKDRFKLFDSTNQTIIFLNIIGIKNEN